MQKRSIGGSAETEHTALLVRPRGAPSLSMVVTTVTPVGNAPTTARKSCPSTGTGLLDRRWCWSSPKRGHANGRNAGHPGEAIGRTLARKGAFASGNVAFVGAAIGVRRAREPARR